MTPEDTEPQAAHKSSAEIAAEWPERTTLPADVRIVVDGTFSSEDEAHEVWAVTHYFLRLFGGGFLDLSGIEAVTVVEDYATALAQVDRGFETSEPPKPTNDEFGAGVAMALPVLRNGHWKTHLFIYSGIGRALLNPEGEWYAESLYTLAHEASHAHDNLRKVTAFPGLFGSRIPDYREGRLFNLADACWSEYIASRLSAGWASEAYCKNMESILVPMLTTARERGNSFIDRFAGPSEIIKTEAELIGVYGTILIRASNLLGQIHEMATTIEESAPEFSSLVNRTPWFKPIFQRFEADLKALDESYPDWKGRDVFEPLQLTCEAMLNAGGMFYIPLGDRYYVELNRPSLEAE